MLRVGLIQLTASDDPGANLPITIELIRRAVSDGATFVLTPEVTNCVSGSRAWQNDVLQTEAEDQTLEGLRALAAELKIWLLIGSLALKTSDPDGRFANRSFLIDPAGQIVARYDKIHMFDVQVSETETYQESAGFRPGLRVVMADTSIAKIGMSVCYDVRFPQLYRRLAHAGAQILTVPAAFSPGTGPMHWEPLLRARAIENGAFVLAPAQTGQHKAARGRARTTWGHSLVVSPWGEILADAGTQTGFTVVDLDLEQVDAVRRKVPSLLHDRPIVGPDE